MAKILILNGPNLNMLGKREKEHYGSFTLEDVETRLKNEAEKLSCTVEFKQNNCEGALIDMIQQAGGEYDAIVLNPGAYTHYSYAIRDAITVCGIPVIEVHISNIHAREEFRRVSVTAPACIGQISGFGLESYVLGLDAAIYALQDRV